jgi:hypothetical protein
MESAVRSSWPRSALTCKRFLAPRTKSCGPESAAANGIHCCGDYGTKIGSRDRQLPRRPRTGNCAGEYARRNAPFGARRQSRGLGGLDGGDSRYRTGCPPPSHRTSLEPESGTGVSNAATERQNRPIWPMFAGRDHANQRLWRACCSQARLGLVRVVVENHSSGYPAVRICRRQCSPSDTSRSLFPQKTVPSRNSSLIVKTPSA